MNTLLTVPLITSVINGVKNCIFGAKPEKLKAVYVLEYKMFLVTGALINQKYAISYNKKLADDYTDVSMIDAVEIVIGSNNIIKKPVNPIPVKEVVRIGTNKDDPDYDCVLIRVSVYIFHLPLYLFIYTFIL